MIILHGEIFYQEDTITFLTGHKNELIQVDFFWYFNQGIVSTEVKGWYFFYQIWARLF
jgi:hypothetical protein